MPIILEKRELAPRTHYFRVKAPLVASHAQAGQFIILRLHEKGERIPLTIADLDRAEGSITLIVQEIGSTTRQMAELQAGDEIRDLLGPLGTPSEISRFGTVVLMGGGFGIAAVHLIGKALREVGNRIVSIIGARTRELLIMESEMRALSDELIVMTDDGSAGRKGLVTEPLAEMIAEGRRVDRVIAIGPMPMMRAVAELTRPHRIKTIVSLNPIMVDGSGMCGGCRVHVGEEMRFACVDGPEFDAHLVDFDELTKRSQMYRDFEKEHLCKLEVAANALQASQAGVAQ
ncbi:MAG: sulfide/dihydroorotate dehydrogenase-like FAD/NAD-binding protein [Candidatus Hydrogenedentota bacterium]|jgi:ferredoxin--NADP+ reductase|uniref:Hydrogenase, subunit gamma related protein n=1 Tax=Sumerlaea chitinivorans TaxID=2250252 RepID=A0A2Z4Y5S6_SUMC1|nr:hydrogenase, subunit gamma related protein [Candidatus Sumerlaea chitinivorans]MCX7964122.1 sulfide/dihydroorotate dehydrogenase-like FAD/NAD-binding protein [Candidatus Sumerlaea chitinivorans]RMH26570.1 MAG: sulfide/dihydroorotate dehydrogenase-like FAD/NAD-binding protein [Candidatus Hydrogenedentota bacterium]GIX44264.1 MAG: ferredoxin-NADP+ reductase subunit alpha [Candidatus Sumerlaea sp.]